MKSLFAKMVEELRKADYASVEIKEWQKVVKPALQEIAKATSDIPTLGQASKEKICDLVKLKFDEKPSLQEKFSFIFNVAAYDKVPVIFEQLIGPKGQQWLIRVYLQNTNQDRALVVYVRRHLKDRKKRKKSR